MRLPAAAIPAATAVGLVLAVAISGCASSTRATASTNTSVEAPAAVALDYMRSLFSGNFAAAARDVAPADLQTFTTLSSLIKPGSVSQHDLAAGSTHTHGNTSLVVITGRICSSFATTSLTPTPSAAANCTTNTNPAAGGPIWSIHLERSAHGTWQVIYPLPPSTKPTAVSTTSAATPAPS